MTVDNKPEQTKSLSAALAHTAKLLEKNALAAEAQAREILKAVPGHPVALLMLASALRRQDRMEAALEILAPLTEAQAKAPMVQFEAGLVLASLGRTREAIAALWRAVRLDPKLAAAWRELGDQFTIFGDIDAADDAYMHQIEAAPHDPRLLDAARALAKNKLAVAERLLREILKQSPTDVPAIRMLAETGMRLGRYEEAEHLYARCVELAPSFLAARHGYAMVLHRLNRPAESLAQTEILLEEAPRNPSYRNLKAAALARSGDTERAIAWYEDLLKEFPELPKMWLSYGHTLKSVGRQKESIAAYRKSVAALSTFGEAYWSLANLKTFRFLPEEIAAMWRALERRDLRDEDRLHFDFALGKALEDAGDYTESFAHYKKGNALRVKSVQFDPDELGETVRRTKSLLTHEFFAERKGSGHPAPDPIFILGLPRAGSTLIEQILASHSAVEGTGELPEIVSFVRRLSGKIRKNDSSAYPDALARLGPDEFKSLGEEYISRTRVQRRSGRPFFIDKMPNNFAHVGLIHLILPNAKIIDARRHPLACCFSCFKQHFARGQGFTYGLGEMGRYYREYVEIMAHIDSVLPERVHRVFYENLVDNPESEVRRLLDYCGLPFESGSLRFYENDRAVRTASSEQVRQPIFREGLDQWRHYEQWLDPLKTTLGNVLSEYPEVPSF